MTFIAGYFAHPGGMQNGNVPGVWPAVSGRQCPAMSIQGPCTQTHAHTHTHTTPTATYTFGQQLI